MLNKLLTADVIRIHSSALDWQDAITKSCQPLIDNGAIEPSYVDAIFRSHKELGPYYVLGPGIAMPHARPEDGVNQLAISLVVISDGVNFSSEGNDPVKMLITLAATDSNSHVEAISKLAELFMNQDDVDAICAAKSVDDISKIIKKY